MDLLKHIAELKDIGKRAGNDLERLEKMQRVIYSQIPPEHVPKLADKMADFNDAFRAIKKGDQSKLNKLMRKYADTD